MALSTAESESTTTCDVTHAGTANRHLLTFFESFSPAGYMLYAQSGYQSSGDIAASSEFRFRGTAAVRTATGELIVSAFRWRHRLPPHPPCPRLRKAF